MAATTRAHWRELYISSAKPTIDMLTTRRNGKVSCSMETWMSATPSMAPAAQKHLAMLSMYLRMKEMVKPAKESENTVAQAKKLKPW